MIDDPRDPSLAAQNDPAFGPAPTREELEALALAEAEYQIVIGYNAITKKIKLTGPLEDAVIFYGILEAAREAFHVMTRHDKGNDGQKSNLLLPRGMGR